MAVELPLKSLKSAFNAYPKPSGKEFTYGTAGFRMNASLLDSIVFKVGILATLRSVKLEGKTIGVMITASHNPPEDNGVKIVDPWGEMLPQSWEPLATQVANTETFQDFIDILNQVVIDQEIDLNIKGKVIIARDTRESGPVLLKAAIDGVNALNGEYKDFGELTTPMLHYLTRCFNDPLFGEPTEQGYNDKIVTTVESILGLWDVTDPLDITVDGANGVGALKLMNLKSNLINCQVVNNNCEDPSSLNVDCGADYVKTGQKLPRNIIPIPGKLYASFDGDADRIVFYYVDNHSNFKLLDGDRIATLLATFINSLLNDLKPEVGQDLELGIVQTAYANGSSTKYIEDKLKLPVSFTPTGVKHLHHKAQEYDIGVYFEANGHGTVIFSNHYIETLENYQTTDAKEIKSLETLKKLVDLINQTVGDSISDLFAVLVALQLTNKSPLDWSSDYEELPNKLFKVIVKDRFMFKTTNAERQLLEPAGLQDKIDATVFNYNKGRSFVRASGTEDAVRVYAEAGTVAECLSLGEEVCGLVAAI